MIQLTNTPDGVLLPVRAIPGAGRNEFRGEQGGALKVAVTKSPEKGKANTAIINTLSKGLGIRKSQIQLVQGPTARDKVFLIQGPSLASLQAKLAELL